MTRIARTTGLAALALTLLAGAAWARGLGVDVWTDRGDDAVYEPGAALQVKVRANEDAYLLVYAISTEGDVRLLWPTAHGRGFAEGRRTYRVPPEGADYDLVADRETGQGYIVAIASSSPFRALPWYLRPADLRGDDIGYENWDEDDEEEGLTREGRIVGDPFVAMERIRRRVLANPAAESDFATSYCEYYVHQQVRYPRYACYECHRPGRWAWWDSFDPYYTRCSVFDFRVNWSWTWGPACWSGYVPYYYYVVRSDCPPHYRRWWGGGHRWSSWDGWRRWNELWGSNLVRHKSPPPQGYVPPPPKGQVWRAGDPTPPGFISRNTPRAGGGARPTVPIGRRDPAPPGSGRDGERARDPEWRGDRETGPKPGVERAPARPSDPDGSPGRREGRPAPTYDPPRRGGGERSPAPREDAPRYDPPRRDDSGDREPAPRQDPPRTDPPRRDDSGDRQPAPRQDAPRYDPPRRDDGGSRQPAPKQDPPRREEPSRGKGHGRS